MRNSSRTFEAFDLLTEVEEGPMGSVSVALDGRSGEKAVLLWLFDRPEMTGEQGIHALTEPGQSPMPSPCVGEFVRCGLVQDTGFAAYERAAGWSLSDLQRRCAESDRKMPVDLALLTTSGVAAALETAHDSLSGEGMPHGCVCPYFVVLMDQGLACVFGFEIADALLSWERNCDIGTPISHYLAPEIRDGGKPDAAGDVFSLGSMLYELLTANQLPLDPEQQQAAIDLAVESESLQPDIAKLIRHSVIDRTQRWPNATVWKRRARKVMRDNGFEPSSATLTRFQSDLLDAQSPARESESTAEAIVDEQGVPEARPTAVPARVEVESSVTGVDESSDPPVVISVEPAPTGLGAGVFAAVAAALLGAVGLAFLAFGPASSASTAQAAAPPPDPVVINASRPFSGPGHDANVPVDLAGSSPEGEPSAIDGLPDVLAEAPALSEPTVDRAPEQSAIAESAESLAEPAVLRDDVAESRRTQVASVSNTATGPAPDPASSATQRTSQPTHSVDQDPPSVMELKDDLSGGVALEEAPGSEPDPQMASSQVAQTEVATPSPAVSAPNVGLVVAPPEGLPGEQVVDSEPAVVRPRLLQIESPKYPRKARRLGLQGAVTVEALVAEDGTVSDVRIVEGLDSRTGIDDAALATVRSARFEAGRRNGRAAAMRQRVTVVFRLED